MLINCDIGEKGPLHEGDRKLMEYIQIANLACDGHAGDKASVDAFRELAGKCGVGVAAHLSYPDKPNFGRASMALPEAELLAALDAQLALLPGVTLVKFHGALYNDAARNPAIVPACRVMSRCSDNSDNVCPLFLNSSSISLRRLASANALNTASICGL